MWSRILVKWTGAVFVCLVCTVAQAERRVALVIGNANYVQEKKRLANPVNDAQDMYAKLQTLGFAKADIVYRENLEQRNIDTTLAAFAKLLGQEDTVALVYYAGHGLGLGDQNYLLAVDARIDDKLQVPRQSIAVSDLIKLMRNGRSRVNLLFLDACRNDPFSRSWGSSERGMTKTNPPVGTWIAYATEFGKTADDGAGQRNGVFTERLLAHIGTPGIALEDMFRIVANDVVERTKNEQTPWPEGWLSKPFYMASALPRPDPVPQPVTPASRVGQVVKDCDECPELVVIPPGSFLMGSDSNDGEMPAHPVTIPRALAVGRTEVTVAQYLQCVAERGCDEPEWREKGSTYHYQTGSDQFYSQLGVALTGDNHPIVGVSWNNTQQYVKWLSAKTGGKGYRLLSEAEWEYAARGGSTANYSFGDSESALGYYAWFSGNSGGKTQPVAQKMPNAFGLYDMHGNVWEWVEDVWHDNYKGAPPDGSAWKAEGSSASRVMRGGSCNLSPWILRSAIRFWLASGVRFNLTGFRIARTFSL